MTTGKRRGILADLHAASDTSPQDSPPWSHGCRKVYGDDEIRSKINPLLCQDGALGVAAKYDFIFSPQSTSCSPRLCFPHRNLDTWVRVGQMCGDTQPQQESTARCEDIRDCRYCRTVMSGLVVHEDPTDERVHCSLQVRRSFSVCAWNAQVVYPSNRAKWRPLRLITVLALGKFVSIQEKFICLLEGKCVQAE